MAALTGKERILAAWKGEQTDRFPFNVDIGPHYTAVLEMTPNDYFGNLETAIDVQVKSVGDFTSDIITIPQNMMGWFGVNSCYRYKSKSDEVQDGSIKTLEDLEDLEAVPASEIEGLNLLKQSCSKITALVPDHASRVGLLGPVLDAVRLTGLEDWVLATIENPDFVHKEMRLTTDASKARALEVVENSDVLIAIVADTFASARTVGVIGV